MSKHFLIFSFLTMKELKDIEKSIPFMKAKEQELSIKLNDMLEILLKAFDLTIMTSTNNGDNENSLHKEFRAFLIVVKDMNKEEYDTYNTKLMRTYLAKREKQRRPREET